jgi:hypothetical protein
MTEAPSSLCRIRWNRKRASCNSMTAKLIMALGLLLGGVLHV